MKYEFPVGFLKDLRDYGEVVDADGNSYVVLDERIFDHTRWSVVYELLFTNENSDRMYITTYSVGATESQDEGPWEYYDDEDMIEVQEAHYVQEPVWRAKPE